jgi:hypothetical protein
MFDYLFSTIYFHFWLPSILISIKILRIENFAEYFSQGSRYAKMHPELEKKTTEFLNSSEGSDSKYIKELNKMLGKESLKKNTQQSIYYIEQAYEKKFWKYYIFIALFIYFFGFLITYYLLNQVGNVGDELRPDVIEVSEFGAAGKYFFLPILSLSLPAPFISIYGSFVAPLLLKKNVISTPQFYFINKVFPMKYNILRNILLAIGICTYYAYISFNYQQIFYVKDKMVIQRLFGKEKYSSNELQAYRFSVPTDKNGKEDKTTLKNYKFNHLELSFGEFGYDSILNIDNKYYEGVKSEDLALVDRKIIAEKVLGSLKQLYPNIHNDIEFDIKKNNKEYKRQAFTNRDFVNQFLLSLMLNFIFLCMFLTFGSKIKVLFGKK